MRFLALLISLLLSVQPAFAQRGVRIVVVEGANTRNVVRQIAPRPLTVRIQDSNGRPIAGAIVEFSAPEGGPSGVFENDSFTISVVSDVDGLASARGYHPNSITGAYNIRARAQFEGETVTTGIPQTNIEQQRSRRKMIAILAIAGAAIGAAIAAGGGSGSGGNGPTNNTPTTPTITFGGSAVGAPNR